MIILSWSKQNMNKLKIDQIFRYPKDKVELDGYPNFSFYTDLPKENLVQLKTIK